MNPRTCVGCRKPDSATELIRLALDRASTTPVVVIDWGRQLAGRGAHLHPADRCIDAALRRQALPRALRVPSSLDMTAIVELRETAQQGRTDSNPVNSPRTDMETR